MKRNKARFLIIVSVYVLLFLCCFLEAWGDTISNTEAGYALSFTGTGDAGPGDVVEISDSSTLTFVTTFTVEAWINPTQLDYGHVVSKALDDPSGDGRGWNIEISDSGTFETLIYYQPQNPEYYYARSNVAISLNVWTHVAGVYDGSSIYTYLNGQLAAVAADTLNIPNTGVPLTIGNDFSGDRPFNGVIDEVRVWNIARSQAQIQSTMNCPLIGNESGLVGYWRFDEGSGLIAYDASGNGNNGYLGGSTTANSNDPTWVVSGAPLNCNSTTTTQPPLCTQTALEPVYTNLPSLKLFIGQSFPSAFNLEDYNSGNCASTYSTLNNFLGLSSLQGSTISQNSYNFATVGENTYQGTNLFGSCSTSNEIKYSTYKIMKLPHVGLNKGTFWDVNVANYTFDSAGPAIPPSFGNPDALTNDNSFVSAVWVGNTIVRLTGLASYTPEAHVSVIASPNANAPFGTDIDIEQIQVYSNLINNGTFTTPDDTTYWMPFELAPGIPALATQSWISSYTDSAGTNANGVWKFTFGNNSTGVKSTPVSENWIGLSYGQWYIIRMRLTADTVNAYQSMLFGFDNYIGPGLQTDIAGNVLFGIPTIWTWQESPLFLHGTTNLVYPQFILKGATPGNIYIDEIQVIAATPTLIGNSRSDPRLHYPYGSFASPTDTTGWGQELFINANSMPEISVSCGLVLNFSANVGDSQGIKWTANNGIVGPLHAYSFPVNTNRDSGMQMTVNIQSGNFNSEGVLLLAAYGIQTIGQQDISPPMSLIASAGIGTLESGTYYAEGNAVNPYCQGQFGALSNQAGVLVITDVDMLRDNDDPNFGDVTLYP